MTITYLSGERIQGVSGDTKPTNVPRGTRFEETNSRKIFRWGDSWVTTSGSLSGGVYHPSGGGDKTDGWNTTGIGIVGGGNRPELDKWNGTTWSDSGHDINITTTGGSGVGTSSSITVAGGDHQSDNSGGACSNYAGGSWTQKANMSSGKSRAAALGTPASWLSVGGELIGGSRSADVQEYDLSGNSWSSGVNLPSGGSTVGVMACAGDGTSTSDGMVVGGTSTDNTKTASAYKFNGSAWTAVTNLGWVTYSAQGGGNSTGFWVMGGDLAAGWNSGVGDVGHWDGTSWSRRPNCLHSDGGAAGANNGGTNPLIAGGNYVGGSGNGSWTTGQYFASGDGDAWIERG